MYAYTFSQNSVAIMALILVMYMAIILANVFTVIQGAQLIVDPSIAAVNESVSFSVTMVG